MSGLTFQDDLHIIAKRGDNYVNFQVARQDSASSTLQYTAWLAAEGSYIFMERNLSDRSNITNKYFFAKASTQAFAPAWADRANKTYVEYTSLFS